MIELAEAEANFGNPSRHGIDQWVHESWEALPGNIPQNAWEESSLSQFPNEEKAIRIVTAYLKFDCYNLFLFNFIITRVNIDSIQ